MFPRSFGLSFAIPVRHSVHRGRHFLGRYRREPLATLTNDRGEPIQVWKRSQASHRVVLPLTEGNSRLESPPWTDQPDVHLRTVCRLRSDRLVVELALVNDQAEPERSRDAAWLFQTRLEVTAAEGEPLIFLPSDGQVAGAESLQEDQQSRHALPAPLEYAVGRNVAVAVEARRELGCLDG